MGNGKVFLKAWLTLEGKVRLIAKDTILTTLLHTIILSFSYPTWCVPSTFHVSCKSVSTAMSGKKNYHQHPMLNAFLKRFLTISIVPFIISILKDSHAFTLKWDLRWSYNDGDTWIIIKVYHWSHLMSRFDYLSRWCKELWRGLLLVKVISIVLEYKH